MREIKFRVWDILGNRMLQWGDIFDLPAWEIFPGTPEQRAFNVMQYTGLKDKNGQEIYEGDIVHRKYHETNNLAIRKVVFQNDGFKLQETGLFTGLSMLYPSLEFIEVISNIYESPELTHGT